MKTLKKFAAIVMRPFRHDAAPADTNTAEPAPAKLNPGKKRSAAKRRKR